MRYKLGIDLGSTSLGWAVVKIDENGNAIEFLDMGVRIFPDGRDDQTKEPLCVSRRNARTSRVRLDRLLMRKDAILNLIENNGMKFEIVDADKTWNPYYLRTRALDEKLTLSQFGRVLFHLSLRRGYLSNRKENDNEDGEAKKKKSKIDSAIENLKNELKGKNCRTLGEYQYNENIYRFNMEYDKKDAKEGSLYPVRKLYEDEFNQIWNKQAEFYPQLTDDLRLKFFNAIFYQRPLKEQDKGFCLFEDNEHREYKASLVFQKFRFYQTLNQLEILDKGVSAPLNEEQKEKIINIALHDFSKINKSGKLSFDVIRKELGLKRGVTFNLASEKRKDFPYDTTSYILSRDEFFGKVWFDKSKEEKDKIVRIILSDKTDDEVKKELGLNSIPNLEKGTGSLSAKAMNKILPYLEQGLLYNEACEKAEYHHSKKDFEQQGMLPYYGDLPLIKKSCIQDKDGIYKITNVSVHIALNQLRIVINELIRNYGKPRAIAIELARDLKVGTQGLKDINNTQARNKKENERIIEEIKNQVGIEHPSKEDILKYKLWENLDKKDATKRCCIYTGKQIEINDLFNKCEIEHILPFSRTYDDSMSNKTISYIKANRYKGNKTPYEAFSENNDITSWNDLMQRVENLPDNMKWRFNKNAIEKFSKDNGPMARALNDTKYMSKLAIDYLKHICEDKNSVYGLPGQMTALFREQWNLDFFKRKDSPEIYRSSHTHHAIDAFVVACMKMGHLQTISKNADFVEKIAGESQKKMKDMRKNLFKDIEKPFDNFDMNEFFEKHNKIVISYKPKMKDVKKSESKNDTIGQLHQETAYGLKEFLKGTEAVFKNGKDKEEKDFTQRIPVFRNKSERYEYIKAYKDWYIFEGQSPIDESKEQKKERLEKEAELLEMLKEKAKMAYKWFVGGNNYSVDVFQIRQDDKKYKNDAGKWKIEIISNFMATINKGNPLWRLKYPAARKVMTLKINDMVKAEFSNKDDKLPLGIKNLVNSERTEIIFRVKKMTGGSVYLRPHTVTQEEADKKSWIASASSLEKYKARKITVTPLGEVIDPGFNDKWSNKNDEYN